jgi:hypothetical protein
VPAVGSPVRSHPITPCLSPFPGPITHPPNGGMWWDHIDPDLGHELSSQRATATIPRSPSRPFPSCTFYGYASPPIWGVRSAHDLLPSSSLGRSPLSSPTNHGSRQILAIRQRSPCNFFEFNLIHKLSSFGAKMHFPAPPAPTLCLPESTRSSQTPMATCASGSGVAGAG